MIPSDQNNYNTNILFLAIKRTATFIFSVGATTVWYEISLNVEFFNE